MTVRDLYFSHLLPEWLRWQRAAHSERKQAICFHRQHAHDTGKVSKLRKALARIPDKVLAYISLCLRWCVENPSHQDKPLFHSDITLSMGKDRTAYRPCQSLGSLDRGLCPWTWPSCPQHWSGYNPWTSSSWPVCGESNHARKPLALQTHAMSWNSNIMTETTISHEDSGAPYLSVQLGQLLLIQIGLFIHSGLISKLKSGQKKRKANETVILLWVENHRKGSCRFIILL